MAQSQWIKRFCFQLRLKSSQLFIIAASVLLSLLITLICVGLTIRYEVSNEVANLGDVDYWKDAVSAQQKLWYDKGIEELKDAMAMRTSESQPRNIQILVINGIDAPALANARFSSSQPSNFVWDRFPHVARIKNSCSHSSPCNAANVIKAIWTGVPLKAAPKLDSSCGHNASHAGQLLSVLRLAQLAGRRTGFVTNQRITGATAAALYANVAQTSWECDGLVPVDAIESGCEDVAQQLISGETGQNLNVLIGGGRQLLSANVSTFPYDPLDELLCRARSGRNLLRDWLQHKLKLKPSKHFELVQREEQLSTVNGNSLDYLLGVLANGDLSRNSQAPSLAIMVDKTLQVLRRPVVGHLLIVEHYVQQQGEARVKELQLLNATLANLLGPKDTLTLVLLTNANNLSSAETQIVSTLQEAFDEQGSHLQRRMQQMPSESLLFATGPKSSLFYSVHEETYLAHALSYALGMDVFGRQLQL
ncbi:GH14069 [Drosophila grimshawi]|uniref:alkaline phosphatase n=1 Tax=Drosophila grimshawi TaxID=7222 RepID=B4JY81_DROGR|nr:GH14069 [Drosophila grimshawi]